ncbi:MAG: cytochrome c oxidase assembly protein [Bacteroidota bacterium]|jgi:cytochrome c oxidase assembly protein subunit 11
MTDHPKKADLATRHRRVAIACAAFTVLMVGLAYASVPLYRLFCQATGFAGTTQRADHPSSTLGERIITVRFDANVGPGLNWDFAPDVPTRDVRVGENVLAFYRVTNRSKRPLVGSATFNVTPDQAGAFFNKIQCFCFTEQRLEPGETVEMPVTFFIDPAIVKDKDGSWIRNITLSYTFYPVEHPKQSADSKPKDNVSGRKS